MRAVESFSRRSWAQAALVALAGWSAAGCSSDITRFSDASFANPFASRPAGEVTGSVPPAQPAPVEKVETRPLAQPQSAQALPPPPAPERRANLFRPAAKPAPAQRTWDWEGGTPVTVERGDTVATLSRRYGVPATAIVQANGLSDPALRPGQRIVIPRYNASSVASAAAPARAGSAGAKPGSPFLHVVAPGETLVGIARRYGKSITEVAAANKIPPHSMVRMGDRIVIPGKLAAASSSSKPAPAPAEPRAPAVAAAPPQVAAAEPTASVLMTTPAAQAAEESEPRRAGLVPAFRWPVRGRVISAFGAKTNGQHNDGINLAVPEGTAVRAAEDGVVAYAGNELKGYGNLILIRHANGFVTAYAHASEILVKRNDQIRRGQVIARSGQTGAVSSPQLHFEIRKGSSPIDPMQFLPAGA